MSKSNEYYRAKMRSEQALLQQQREVDSCGFNDWVRELEEDTDYLAKVEKRLDDELGKDRLF